MIICVGATRNTAWCDVFRGNEFIWYYQVFFCIVRISELPYSLLSENIYIISLPCIIICWFNPSDIVVFKWNDIPVDWWSYKPAFSLSPEVCKICVSWNVIILKVMLNVKHWLNKIYTLSLLLLNLLYNFRTGCYLCKFVDKEVQINVAPLPKNIVDCSLL